MVPVSDDVDVTLAAARAVVLADLTATGAAEPATVSVLEDVVASRREWVTHWPDGAVFAAGLVAQDVQDTLLETHGRWPLCPLCEDATHAVFISPDLGGPDPTWVCEESGREVAPLGSLGSPPPS
ncbi:hypothetical protein G7072_01645 [Nocardioides sp. HDW12B]|nr:hypothetical protein G7072_01645 [Nocardioides sp. HDW12B]